MKDGLPVVKRAIEAVSGVGGTPIIRAANGGLDANWMVRHGIPTVTFGAGQNEPHTTDEWIKQRSGIMIVGIDPQSRPNSDSKYAGLGAAG